jgi:XTP/dITP diphosphohydrolase
MTIKSPTLLVATHNRDKVLEIHDLLKYQKVNVKSLRDFPNLPHIQETGSTLEENAILKARNAFEKTGLTTVADDTGLEVDALNGAPGAMSARYSGPEATYQSNMQKLLEELKNVEQDHRTACFRCVMALVWKDDMRVVEGRVEGLILSEPHGSGGFGYDPIFYHPPTGFTFAEMPLSLKNQFSHRSIALKHIVHIIANEYRFSIL